MCTVTVITTCDAGTSEWRDPPPGVAFDTPAAVRLMCNRDESRKRALAFPPRLRQCGERVAVMPIDPASDGTWIAANDAGLVATLLNANPSPHDGRPDAAERSRGIIVPRLLAGGTLDAAMELAARLDPHEFAPFRAIVLNRRELVEIQSNGVELQLSRAPLRSRAWLFTSSGLGDAVVEPPRRALFEQTLERIPTAAAQAAFHASHWPDQPHLSVWMERADARTVSTTRVELSANAATMTYTPAEANAVPTELRIPFETRLAAVEVRR